MESKYKIRYIILNDKFPFIPDNERKEAENLKRTPDKNKKERQENQNYFIEKYRPMTQKPYFYQDKELAKLKKGNIDSMIEDPSKRNEIVRDGLLNHKDEYKEIIEKIKEKH